MILPIITNVSEEVDCKLYLITMINSLGLRPSDFKRLFPSAHPHSGRPCGRLRDPPVCNPSCSHIRLGTKLVSELLSVFLLLRRVRLLAHTVLSGLVIDGELWRIKDFLHSSLQFAKVTSPPCIGSSCGPPSGDTNLSLPHQRKMVGVWTECAG